MQFRQVLATKYPFWGRMSWLVLALCTVVPVSCAMASPAPTQNSASMNDQSLEALQKANAYGATLFQIQPPGPDFVRQMRIAIPRDYSKMDQGIRTGLANIERDLPYLSSYFANKNRQQLSSFVATYRAKIMGPKDPIEQQVLLAEVMSFVALTSYRQHQNGSSANRGFQQQQLDTLKNKQLQGAARSFSPTCVPGSKDASCHP